MLLFFFLLQNFNLWTAETEIVSWNTFIVHGCWTGNFLLELREHQSGHPQNSELLVVFHQSDGSKVEFMVVDSFESPARVPSNGGSLRLTKPRLSAAVDVNGGHTMLGLAALQMVTFGINDAWGFTLRYSEDCCTPTTVFDVARELRLRDIGGIIVVDFIDMSDESNKKLVYEEMKKAVERDRSVVRVSELSKNGLMEITRKRVRPSVNFMITEPCNCCHATGRVEALETSFSKIELEICRLLSSLDHKPDLNDAKSWPKFVLRVDQRLQLLNIREKIKTGHSEQCTQSIDRGFPRGAFEVKPFTGEKEKHELHGAISSLKRPETHLRSNTVTLFPIKKRSGSVK
ncbi:hypothetical protein HPP92_002615 [Vanilla planifolia]|uniref:RNA-binding protein AU-1/Ribonuclease E/G domain-containing protein n=1 Tax=Vanilla planifolia TaxID=51239 RepID=A0A835S4P7_VANPL|nr:hypothetical protein HPP92_002615 [Vanilla planifolia]